MIERKFILMGAKVYVKFDDDCRGRDFGVTEGVFGDLRGVDIED